MDPIGFAERLKVVRKQRGISESELAIRSSIDVSEINLYEQGETKPDVEALTKLAQALDTTVTLLIYGTTIGVHVQEADLKKVCPDYSKCERDIDSVLIQLTNQKAMGLLSELEELQMIGVLKANFTTTAKPKLSDKYKGIISKEEGQSLNEHILQMRSE